MLLIAALAVGAATFGIARLTTDNSPSIFFVAGSERWARYQDVRRAFGPDVAARLVVSGPALWSDEGLAWLEQLETAAAGIPGVRTSVGLMSHHRTFEAEGSAPLAAADLRRRALANTLDRNLGWIDADGRWATILVTLEAEADGASVLAALKELVAAPPAGLEASVAGSPVLDRALDESSRRVQTRESPLLVVMAVLLLAVVFRDLRGILVPLAFVLVCVGPLLGVMGWLGVSMNLVLAVLSPLLFVISMATAIHLLVRFRGYRLEPPAAVAATFRDKGWPVLWTGITTFVGFVSLTVSPVGPVRSLGLWSGLGIAWMTVAAFVLLPAFLAVGERPLGAGTERHPFAAVERWGRRVAEWSVRRRGWVIAATVLTALGAVAGVARLQTESNALTYLDPSHPARASIETLQEAGIGSALIEIDLSQPPDAAIGSGEAPAFSTLDDLARLSELAADLRGEPLVLGAVSAGDLLDDTAALSGLPPPLAWRGLLLDPRGRQVVAGWRTPEGDRARVTVFAQMVGFDRLEPLLERLEGRARMSFPAADVAVTGEYPLLLESQKALIRTLAVSLALTFLAVAVVFRLLLGTTRLTLLAMVPNLWPVIGVLGWMGWSGTPLDVATVMVASVLLGLAVDDTLHTLGHFRRDAPSLGAHRAVARALEQTAPSYLLTGTVLAVGFGVCALSQFAPTARFGMLSALGIALAVVGDLVVVPALLGSTPQSAVQKIRGG